MARFKLPTTRAGSLTKAAASALFSQGELIRIQQADGSNWTLVSLKDANTLHDAVLAKGFRSFGLDNTARFPIMYFHEPKKDKKKRESA